VGKLTVGEFIETLCEAGVYGARKGIQMMMSAAGADFQPNGLAALRDRLATRNRNKNMTGIRFEIWCIFLNKSSKDRTYCKALLRTGKKETLDNSRGELCAGPCTHRSVGIPL